MVDSLEKDFDVAVVGAGIVGLASARSLSLADPSLRVIVLEKEDASARHQSGRNSGVLHSGVYYRPGSAKARTCRRGRELMRDFCEQKGVPLVPRGKLIVALDQLDVERLEALAQRAGENGVSFDRVRAAGMARVEPHVAGLEALHVPDVPVLDYGAVCRALAEDLRAAGHEVRFGARVFAASRGGRGQLLRSTRGNFEVRRTLTCGGLQSDRLARLLDSRPESVRIVPFRGEYLALASERRELVRGLVYPVPDPQLPFLGVHLTRRHDDSVDCGPNALFSLSREGYDSRSPRFEDLLDSLAWPGFRRLVAKHAARGLGSAWRALSRGAFVSAARRLVPALRAEDFRSAPTGIRAQAVARDGSLVDDFLFEESPGVLHVLNAPSPAATSALAIGEEVAERLLGTA